MTLARQISEESVPGDHCATALDKPSPEAEQQLVYSLRRGEDYAFETLVRSYGPHVMAVARRYLRDEQDAADCFQETFIAVFQSIDTYARRSSFRHWVRGVAINKCLMKLRRRQRRREESIEHMLPLFDENGSRVEVATPRQEAGMGVSLDAERLRRTVRESIDRLPDDYRVVILLRDIDGYSTKEAASILGIRVNAAKTRLHRARSALRHMLEPILEQIGNDADL